MSKLQGKIALISGGTTGIGAATARRFREEGATVVATGSNPQTLAAARDALPGVEVVASDASDPAAIRALVADVKARHGRIDVLFVNAGIARFAPNEAVDEAFFDAQFDLNVRGAFFLIQQAAAAMPSGGSIVLTASNAAQLGLVGGTVYGATKAALRSLGRSFAAELAPRGIRVNTLSPGPVDTPIFGKVGFTPEQQDAFVQQVVAQMPLGRRGRAQEIAAAALFLASDEASFMTGSELVADGGMSQV